MLSVEDAELELVRYKGSSVTADTYSFSNLVCCKCHC